MTTMTRELFTTAYDSAVDAIDALVDMLDPPHHQVCSLTSKQSASIGAIILVNHFEMDYLTAEATAINDQLRTYVYIVSSADGDTIRHLLKPINNLYVIFADGKIISANKIVNI